MTRAEFTQAKAYADGQGQSVSDAIRLVFLGEIATEGITAHEIADTSGESSAEGRTP